MQSFLARVLLLVAGLLIGFGGVIGLMFLLQNDSKPTPDEHTKTTSEEESLPHPNTARSTDTDKSRSKDAVPSRVDQLVFPKRTFDRKATILSWVEDLTDNEIINWLEQSTDPTWQVSSANRNELQTTLLQKLSTNSPERAVEFALAREEERDAIWMANTVFQIWANTDIDGAVARAKELKEQETNNFIGTILTARDDLQLERMREIASELGDESFAFTHHFRNLTLGDIENPKETWYEIINLATRESVQDHTPWALRNVAVAWVEEKGLDVLAEIVSSMSSDSEYDTILPTVFNGISATRPEEIFDYIMSNLGDRATEIIERSHINYNWSRKDPKGMLAKAESLPASRLRQNMVQQAVWGWAEQNPRELLEQLELLPPNERERASRNAIQSLTQTSPTEAVKFVMQVTDEELQLQLAQNLVQRWVFDDASAAKEWVLNLPVAGPMRASLTGPLTNSLVYTDPRGAFEFALQQPIEESSRVGGFVMGQEVSVLGTIAWQDIDLAMELLPKVRDSGKESAFSTVGSRLILQGHTKQALQLANQLTDKQQKNYYQSITMIWSNSDPKGLLKAFDDFPNTVKSKIALSMVWRNETSSTYSKDEIESIKKNMNKEDSEMLNQLQEIDMNNPSSEDLDKLRELNLW